MTKNIALDILKIDNIGVKFKHKLFSFVSLLARRLSHRYVLSHNSTDLMSLLCLHSNDILLEEISNFHVEEEKTVFRSNL